MQVRREMVFYLSLLNTKEKVYPDQVYPDQRFKHPATFDSEKRKITLHILDLQEKANA